MKKLASLALRFDNGKLELLNQKKLPQTEEWITCNTPQQMYECILDLKVRGAPLIGIAATLLLAKITEENTPIDEIKNAASYLISARPTAVNLMICVTRFLASLEINRETAIATAEKIFIEDIQLCDKMAEHGAALVHKSERIMTYCNTGGLATAGVGTALGIIKKAHQQGKNIHAYVNETRPLLQGGRLTAWELEQAKVPYSLICDNMAAYLMQLGKVDRIFVGSDRITANGDFANKIGTYNLAVLAHHHSIPFYVVAPYTTVDTHCKSGAEIIIEQRHADEVRGVSGEFGKVIWAPTESAVFNPSFDVTPAHLVTAYILDKGILTQEAVYKGALLSI